MATCGSARKFNPKSNLSAKTQQPLYSCFCSANLIAAAVLGILNGGHLQQDQPLQTVKQKRPLLKFSRVCVATPTTYAKHANTICGKHFYPSNLAANLRLKADGYKKQVKFAVDKGVKLGPNLSFL